MRWLFGLTIVVGACGDNVEPPIEPPELPAITPECHEAPLVGSGFETASEFAPAVPGTLADWEPDGRWFLTGIRMGGVGSVHFVRQGAEVVVDRNTDNPGTIDDNEVFHRELVQDNQGRIFVIAKHVSNFNPDDGSLRVERAVCDDERCNLCTGRMIRAERFDDQPSNKLVQIGSFVGPTWEPGFTFNVRVLGNLAYVIRQDGLHIVDITNPTAPFERGHYRRAGDGYSNDVKLVDTATKRYALIADSPVDVVDVTNPDAPVFSGQIPEEAHTLFTETRGATTIAYFGNYDGTSAAYDVTDPASPTRVGRYETGGNIVHDLMVKDGIAYLNAWELGLLVVDFNTPATPVLRGAWADTPTDSSHSSWVTTIGGRTLALHGEESYGAHLDLVDVDAASPTFMRSIGSYKTRDWVSIHNVMAFGDRGYIAYYQDGVRVVDLADPAHPREIGYFNTWDPQADYTSSRFFEGAVGIDVDPARKLIFIADSPGGLLILRDDT